MIEPLTNAEYNGIMDMFFIIKDAADKGSALERKAANTILQTLSFKGDGRYFKFIEKLQEQQRTTLTKQEVRILLQAVRSGKWPVEMCTATEGYESITTKLEQMSE